MPPIPKMANVGLSHMERVAQAALHKKMKSFMAALLASFTGPFRFADLPADLRHAIYQLVVPHGRTVGFEREFRWRGQGPWFITGLTEYDGLYDKCDCKDLVTLFTLSKQISEEARALFYGTNTFQFSIDGGAQNSVSLSSPKIFGPLGEPLRLRLLRDLRKIELDLTTSYDPYWSMRRHRARLQKFVAVIKEHADDGDRASLLTNLSVKIDIADTLLPEAAQCIFALEELAPLRGIEDVKITGDVPDWFARCLQCCIQGRGGNVKKQDYPLVEVKSKKKGSGFKKKPKWVETKQWYNPEYDWAEFAGRNGIELPENFQEYYAIRK